jgi:hypothetical protein
MVGIKKLAPGLVALGVAGIMGICSGAPPVPKAPGYDSARAYAVQCHGTVTDPYGLHGGPYVEGCTR